MVQEAIRAAIPRAAGAFALGASALAAVTAVSLWLGFDSGPTAFLYLIVITLLSLVSGFLPAFCLSILAVGYSWRTYTSRPDGSSSIQRGSVDGSGPAGRRNENVAPAG